MKFDFSPDDLTFQKEVRSFLDASLPDDIRKKVASTGGLDKSDFVEWQKILFNRGWIAPNWPKEYGGCEWSPTQQYIFGLECGLAGAPRPIPFGLNMVGPVIYTFGNAEQKAAHLPSILSSDVWWCQGYSEPEAGSDLAALKTSAVRDGDEYVINGTKIWTTSAHWADWIFCLVRTSKEDKPQRGISFVLIDMRSPGLSVEPIITIDGGHHVNQVFLDDVRIPVENLIGDEGKGWNYAKFLLANERLAIADIGQKKRQIASLRRMARKDDAIGTRLSGDEDFLRRLTGLEIQVLALEYTELRYLDDQSRGKTSGFEPSLLKVRATELEQSLAELFVDALEQHGLAYITSDNGAGHNRPQIGPVEAHSALQHYLYGRASTIYGGSTEIQRNIMAKTLFAL